MRLLWPPPAQVRAAPRRTAHSDYIVIPSASNPKLLVPSRPRRVAAGAIRNFKTASNSKERVQLTALALAARAGLHSLLPDQFTIAPGDGATPGIDAHLAAVLNRPVHVSLYIGPPRAVRKPVLQVLTDRGETLAFAKLSADAFTDELVQTEARIVTDLSSASWSVLRVPSVLHFGEWQRHQLLVQSAFPRGAVVALDDALLMRATDELAAVHGLSQAALGESTYWHRLNARIHALPASASRDQLVAGSDALGRLLGETELEFGASHGDWAPWNMTIADGQIRAWDWEKFELDVPVGFDLVHFSVQGDVVFGGATPVEAFEAASERALELVPRARTNRAALVVVWLYAVDIASRYLVDREQDAGRTKMTSLDDWLGPVMELASARAALRQEP
jgi:hypothetical protein